MYRSSSLSFFALLFLSVLHSNDNEPQKFERSRPWIKAAAKVLIVGCIMAYTYPFVHPLTTFFQPEYRRGDNEVMVRVYPSFFKVVKSSLFVTKENFIKVISTSHMLIPSFVITAGISLGLRYWLLKLIAL